MDSACALVARGRRLRTVSQTLDVSPALLSVHVHRKPDWRDGRQHDDSALLARIMDVVAELPSYGYRRVWALLRRQSIGRVTTRSQRQAGISRHARSWNLRLS